MPDFEFTHAGLSQDDLDPNPFKQFERWFQQAQAVGLAMPVMP